MNRLSIILAALLVSSTSMAAQVSPTPAADIGHNGSTPTSGTVVLNDGSTVNGYRTDCLLQNNGVNILYYKFETAGSNVATVTTGDKQLGPGTSMSCNNGVTISSTALSIMGSSGDKYALSEQFVRAQ